MPHQVNELLLELFVIFVWTKFFGEVFEQLRMPAVLGEILAGVVLGPYATGLIQPSETLRSIAQIGAIFLLFTVGLETHPKELIRVGNKALQVAIAGIVVPFALGFGYMLLRHEPPHQATFVAAAMVATSVGITARIMHDMNVMNTRAARIIMGAAVFDDIGGMILLAVVVALAAGGPTDYLQIGIVIAGRAGAGTPAEPKFATNPGASHLPGTLSCSGTHRAGSNYRRILCRHGVRGICRPMEAAAASECHQ